MATVANHTATSGAHSLPEFPPIGYVTSATVPTAQAAYAHDAFDCYRILVHGGDFKAAVKAAAYLLGMNGTTRANHATIFAGGVPCPHLAR